MCLNEKLRKLNEEAEEYDIIRSPNVNLSQYDRTLFYKIWIGSAQEIASPCQEWMHSCAPDPYVISLHCHGWLRKKITTYTSWTMVEQTQTFVNPAVIVANISEAFCVRAEDYTETWSYVLQEQD